MMNVVYSLGAKNDRGHLAIPCVSLRFILYFLQERGHYSFRLDFGVTFLAFDFARLSRGPIPYVGLRLCILDTMGTFLTLAFAPLMGCHVPCVGPRRSHRGQGLNPCPHHKAKGASNRKWSENNIYSLEGLRHLSCRNCTRNSNFEKVQPPPSTEAPQVGVRKLLCRRML